MAKYLLALASLSGMLWGYNPCAFAQPAFDCYSAQGKEQLINITVNRARQIGYNYSDALDYYIRRDYQLCSDVSTLSSIASGINIFVKSTWIKAAIYGILGQTPAIVCGVLKYRKKSRYARPESAYMGDLVNALRASSDRDAQQTCISLDPATLNAQYFIGELSRYWE